MFGTVVIVEDNLDEIALYQHVLNRLDFPILLRVFNSGADAQAFFQAFNPRDPANNHALYVLDLDLPAVGGEMLFDTIVRAYQRVDLRRPPTVFLTHWPRKSAYDRARAYHDCEVIRKPYQLEDYEVIFQHLGARAAA